MARGLLPSAGMRFRLATLSPLSLAALALLAACSTTSFTLPMTSTEAAHYGSGPALVAYLSQSGADTAICDARAAGPHIAVGDPSIGEVLTAGLRDGKIDPVTWRTCVDRVLASVPADDAATLLDSVAHAYRDVLADGHFETDARLQARVAAMHALYVERPRANAPHSAVMDPLVLSLRNALRHKVFGPLAARYGTDLVALIDLEHGRADGAPVTTGTLDGFLERRDEQMLLRCSARLPDPTLRDEAKRRVIRLRIAASTFPEVKEDAAAVERTMMSNGTNPVSLALHRFIGASMDAEPPESVLVRQDVAHQTVTLLDYSGDRPGLAVVPVMNLRAHLAIRLDGMSMPVTLCAPPAALDVAPCIPVSNVHVGSVAASLDADGTLHLSDALTSAEAVALVEKQSKLVVPLSLGAAPLVSLAWPMYFERPSNMVFPGATAARGPDIHVSVVERPGGHMIFTVSDAGQTFVAGVELRDLAGFVVASRGGSGFSGADGTNGFDGSDGSSGMDASCGGGSGSNGGDGSNGSDGADGGPSGPGGDGGTVTADYVCTDVPCAPNALAQVIRSEGGAGGPGGSGGSGGRGGRGGRGGSSANCTDSKGMPYSVSGGSAGSDGQAGRRGSDGSSGPAGAAGKVVWAQPK